MKYARSITKAMLSGMGGEVYETYFKSTTDKQYLGVAQADTTEFTNL